MRLIFEDAAKDVRAATRQAQAPRTYGDLESRVGLDGEQLASITPEPVKLPPAMNAERLFWDNIKGNDDVADFEEYKRKWPKGEFVGLADNRIRRLKATAAAPAVTPPDAVASPCQQPRVKRTVICRNPQACPLTRSRALGKAAIDANKGPMGCGSCCAVCL